MERHKEESAKGKVRWPSQGSQARSKVLRKSVRKNPGMPGMVGTKGKKVNVYKSISPPSLEKSLSQKQPVPYS